MTPTWDVYYWHEGYLYSQTKKRLDPMTVEQARELIGQTDADLYGHHTGHRAVLLEVDPHRTTYLGMGKR